MHVLNVIELIVEYCFADSDNSRNQQVIPAIGDCDEVDGMPRCVNNIFSFDIFLGGCSEAVIPWRSTFAAPICRQNGFSFHPKCESKLFDFCCNNKDRNRLSVNNTNGKSSRRSRSVDMSSINIPNFIEPPHDVSMSSIPASNGFNESLTTTNGTNSLSLDYIDDKSIEDKLISDSMDDWVENVAKIEQSRVLLFFISSRTRGLVDMIFASHCISLGYRVVLCVQNIDPNDAVVENERLSIAALKDYNRGRTYLIDIAEREDVPVYSCIKEAVQHCSDMIQSMR